MIIGLQITKNKDKYNKLVSLLNKNQFKGVSFIHISDYRSLKLNFKDKKHVRIIKNRITNRITFRSFWVAGWLANQPTTWPKTE